LHGVPVRWQELPLMEEEVLIVRDCGRMLFDFHKSIFEKVVARYIGALEPVSIEERGDRVVVELDAEKGEELRAWLLLNLGKGFFITELESLDLT